MDNHRVVGVKRNFSGDIGGNRGPRQILSRDNVLLPRDWNKTRGVFIGVGVATDGRNSRQ